MGHHLGGSRHATLAPAEVAADQLNTPACAWVCMVHKAVVRADEMASSCTAPLKTELYLLRVKHGDPGSW